MMLDAAADPDFRDLDKRFSTNTFAVFSGRNVSLPEQQGAPEPHESCGCTNR
jgi:hypothetical protein